METNNLPRTTLLNNLKYVKNEETRSSFNVERNSDDWRFVEFHLKSNVPYECEVEKIHLICNTHMKTNFEKASKNKLTAYTWVSKSTLDNNINGLHKLRTRGRFEINYSGMDFLYGCMFENSSPKENQSFFILCKIIIGRSFCKLVRDKNELTSYIMDINQRNYLPEGYDSVMFSPLNYFTSSYPSLQTSHKTIRYRIFDANNVLPMFYVEFVPQAYHLFTYISKKLCDECSEKEADFYCIYCEANFCTECNSNVHHEHSNDKALKALYEKHLNSKIPVSKVTSGICDCNMSKEVEFYCYDCNKTICSFCRLLGSHSKGEMVNHELVDVNEQYNKLNPEKEESMKHMNDKIKKGQETISKLKFQIHQLRENTFLEAEKQLEFEAEKDYTHAQLVLTDDIHLNITKLNLLSLIRDVLLNTSDYYNLRQNLVKNVSMPEFIYVWFTYKRLIDSFNNNIEYYNMKNKFPDRTNYILNKFNEFKLINFNFEENQNTKEKNKEEITKISSDMRKQVFDKDHQKLNIGNTKILKEMIKNHMNVHNNSTHILDNNILKRESSHEDEFDNYN